MKRLLILVVGLLAIGCSRNCSQEFINDFNSTFATSMSRGTQCDLARSFKEKWGGKVCEASQNFSNTTIDADSVADSAINNSCTGFTSPDLN